MDKNTAQGSRSPNASSKPFLDGRCEWHRGGMAIDGNDGRNPFLRPQPECQNKVSFAGAQWCVEHKCVAAGCDLARVKDDKCVRHQPGSRWMQRQAVTE